MACKLSSRVLLPYISVLLVGLSIVFPRKADRDVRTLRSDFEQLRADNASLRADFIATLDFLRSSDFASFVVPDADGGGDAGLSSVSVAVADGCTYMRVGGVDGVRCGNDWWLVGDDSPWGVLESAFRGGFVADGRRYRCSVMRDIHEL